MALWMNQSVTVFKIKRLFKSLITLRISGAC